MFIILKVLAGSMKAGIQVFMTWRGRRKKKKKEIISRSPTPLSSSLSPYENNGKR